MRRPRCHGTDPPFPFEAGAATAEDFSQIKAFLEGYIPATSLVKVFDLKDLRISGHFARITVLPKDVVTDRAFVLLEKKNGQWGVIWGPGPALGAPGSTPANVPSDLLRA